MSESAGVHVAMDGYVRDASVFSKGKIEELFRTLADALQMKMLADPIIYEIPVDPEILEKCKNTGNFEDEGGITGIAVISTSHMSIHCWPLQKFFSLDTFSCKNFDPEKAVEIIRDIIGVDDDRIYVLHRKRPDRK